MASPPAVCPSCQTPLPADAEYCPHCGTRTPTQISGGGTTSVAPPPDQLEEQHSRLQSALGNDYVVERLLGTGGFAAVWAAFDRKLQRRVAVKVLHPDLVATKSLLERFQREAQAVAKLRHPGVIPIYAVGEYEGLAYYIMPLVEGETLRDRLTREGALAPAEVGRILREVAAALAVAHEAGIVHRDIKPENLMLEGKDRRVLVMDFGIAKSTAGTQTGLTGTGMIVGTPTYMSPEQGTGSKEVDVRSDIYSLGVVGYELLIGKPLFAAQSVPELILHHVSTPAPSVAAGRPDIPESLAIAINRCLVKRPEERWKDAGDLSAFLERTLTPAGKAVAVSKELRKYARRHWRPSSRQIVWAAVAAVAVATVLAFGVSPGDAPWAVGYWARHAGLGRPQQAGIQPEAWELEGSALSHRAAVLPMADAGLAVVDGANFAYSLHVFDGHSWRSTRGPGWVKAAAQTGDSLLLFVEKLQSGGGNQVYRWSATGLVPVDTAPFDVTAAWADTAHAVAIGGFFFAPWQMASRDASGWRRVASPSRLALYAIAGTGANDLVALGRIGFSDLDSIAEFNGISWRTFDPRPRGTKELWRYATVTTLGDGTFAVGGESGHIVASGDDTAFAGVQPLLLLRSSHGGWRKVAIKAAASVTAAHVAGNEKDGIIGMWGATPNDMFVWTDCDSCRLGEIRNGVWTDAPDIGSGSVVGIARGAGAIYAVKGDGTVWANRGGDWVFVTEVPNTTLTAAASASGPDWLSAWSIGSGHLGPPELCSPGCGIHGSLPGSLPDSARGIAVGRDLAWALGPNGEVSRLSRPSSARAQWSAGSETFTGVLALLQRLRGGALVVGAHGLLARSNALGVWTRLRAPAAMAQESLLSASESPDGQFAVLGTRHYAILDSLGRENRLGAVRSLPSAGCLGVLLNDAGAVALVYPRVVRVQSLSGRLVRSVDAYWGDVEGRFSTWLTLPDGRFLVGLAGDPADPFARGGVVVVAADSTTERDSTVAVAPSRSSVTALSVGAHDVLAYTRSGQFARPLASLPFGPRTAAPATGPQR